MGNYNVLASIKDKNEISYLMLYDTASGEVDDVPIYRIIGMLQSGDKMDTLYVENERLLPVSTNEYIKTLKDYVNYDYTFCEWHITCVRYSAYTKEKSLVAGAVACIMPIHPYDEEYYNPMVMFSIYCGNKESTQVLSKILRTMKLHTDTKVKLYGKGKDVSLFIVQLRLEGFRIFSKSVKEYNMHIVWNLNAFNNMEKRIEYGLSTIRLGMTMDERSWLYVGVEEVKSIMKEQYEAACFEYKLM